MTIFIGTEGNDVANASIAVLTGFTGGSVAQLQDGVGDFFAGGGGEDFVFAANADDLIEGGEGHDVLNGGAGNDTIYANTEPNPAGSLIGDEIVGNLGNDTLVGSNGNDVMDGAQGEDSLRGRGGADILSGGDGRDRLVFATDDVSFGEIIDGGSGIDAIAVSGTVTFTNAASIANIEEVLFGGDATATFTAHQVKTGLAANLHIAGDYKYGADTFRIEMGSEASIDVPNFTFDDWNANDRIEIVGDADDEVIFGTGQIDHLFGNGGDDTLAGGVGADQLFGGLGNDVYFVDPAGSEVFEHAGEGDDSVVSFFSHTLAANVESLTLLGTGGINGTGNALANTIIGNSGDNFLNGAAGTDLLQGGRGNDTYLVNATTDAVVEAANAGIDQVHTAATFTLGANVENLTLTGAAAISGTGNTLVNNITGNTGNNTLSGGAGADFLRGGLGNDIYVVDNVADKAIEAAGAGTDRVDSAVSFTLGANVENLTLIGAAAINGTGNTLVNNISGNTGNNTLNGGAAADFLRGGLGNDIYVVDNVADQAIEAVGAGIDRVDSAVTFTLGVNVENLTLTGAAATNGAGNTLANILIGNVANNVLYGMAGADSLRGGLGNDTYVVDNAADQAIEAASAGIDRVNSAATFTLGVNVENLMLTGAAAINGTGNTLANVITGNTANNTLNGRTGSDTLTGSTGNDTFRFDTALGASNIDRIVDFDVDTPSTADSFDTIQLENAVFTQLTTTGDLAPSGFLRVTNAADFDNGRTITYVSSTGGLFYDTNGAAAGGATQFGVLKTGLALTNADFFVT